VARIERLTGRPAHPFLKRGVFFAHRWAAPPPRPPPRPPRAPELGPPPLFRRAHPSRCLASARHLSSSTPNPPPRPLRAPQGPDGAAQRV
jgi:hypothetical protein